MGNLGNLESNLGNLVRVCKKLTSRFLHVKMGNLGNWGTFFENLM